MTSTHLGMAKGRWPIHADPDDITRVYFRDPETREWHALRREHAPSLEMPLSEDALKFARKLAAAKYTYPDDKIAIADLLERWNIGLGEPRAERRIALRLSRERSALIEPDDGSDVTVTQLPSVARVLAAATKSPVADVAEPVAETGDDDADDIDDVDNFYADALEDVWPSHT